MATFFILSELLQVFLTENNCLQMELFVMATKCSILRVSVVFPPVPPTGFCLGPAGGGGGGLAVPSGCHAFD